VGGVIEEKIVIFVKKFGGLVVGLGKFEGL
jgi:hypothetical protein